MKNIKVLKFKLVFLSSLMLTGCGGGLPECGDPAATNLVKEIYLEKLTGAEGSKSLSASQILVDSVETISKDDKLKKNQCKANIKWKMTEDLVRIIEIINQPSKVKAQALLVGALQADPTMTTLMSLGGRSLGDKEQQMIKKNNYEMSLKEDTYNPVFQVLRININKLIESSSVTIDKNIITLGQAKTEYTIRLSEDKDSKNKFIVEAKYNIKSLDVIGSLEALVEMEREGKKIIDEFSKNKSANSTAEQKNTQTPEKHEAPTAEAPTAEAPSAEAPKTGYYLDKLKNCKIYTPSIENKSGEWSGECKSGYGHGKGVLKIFLKNEHIATYEGSLLEGKIHGYGKYDGPDGVYVGGWSENYRSGPGKFINKNGVTFEGNFKKGFPDGEVKVSGLSGGKQELQAWADGKRIK